MLNIQGVLILQLYLSRRKKLEHGSQEAFAKGFVVNYRDLNNQNIAFVCIILYA